MKQTTFASLVFDGKKKQTRRERFLVEREAVVPWAARLAVIEPHYPKAQRLPRPSGGYTNWVGMNVVGLRSQNHVVPMWDSQ
ncbi:hypothetical protein EV699_11440 [Plasticicumulans lactativorans]|uniref:Transposase n=1 Tax=Plasticicumulans lactativorans TaxID=1133106 RepID=A0A4R2L8I7_9GAMM|nr:hypothetical protein EV699_11440 [Plasticicumulans lactativorans]